MYEHRYSVWFGLTGRIWEITVSRDTVRNFDVDTRRVWNTTRHDLAVLLSEHRHQQSTSIVRER